MISERVIGRLSLYRRILEQMQERGETHVFSHQLADQAGCTPAQVRRDLMSVDGDGTPSRGYDIEAFLNGLNAFLVRSTDQNVVLVGVGNLGRALLAYFAARRSNLKVVAAFDTNPERTGRVIFGCRCYANEELAAVLAETKAQVAVLAVPAQAAQRVADELIRNNIRGILNYAPTTIQVPPTVFVENIDMTVALEKVAFFAHQGRSVTQAAGVPKQ